MEKIAGYHTHERTQSIAMQLLGKRNSLLVGTTSGVFELDLKSLTLKNQFLGDYTDGFYCHEY